MLAPISLYLTSRNSYKASREILLLPCGNAVRNYFEKYGLNGGNKKYEKTFKTIFNSLNYGKQILYIYGASAFIVRLALVRNFSLEFLHDAVRPILGSFTLLETLF